MSTWPLRRGVSNVSEREFAAVFEEQFAKPPSSVEARASMAAMGDEYPTGLHTYSWVSRTELRHVADHVTSIGGQHVVDVGCGRGGPGLWVAKTTGARLTGLDIADSALAQARELTQSIEVEAEFVQGTFEDTHLQDSVADLVMSFDSFLFTPDKGAAFVELGRILRPGGRLAITSWDYHHQPPKRPPQVDDHRPLAEAAGFAVLEYVETDDWRGRCVAFADYMLEHAEEAAVEADVPLDEMRDGLRDMRATIDCMSRRFLMVAERDDA